MNTTFQRLLGQATTDALHATRDAQDYVGNPVARQQRELQLEKFAELIVRECADIVADAVDHREPASTYVDKIKQHFGVEE